MKALDALIEHLETDETVVAYKRIEKKILTTPKYQDQYQDLLNKQKAMVQARERQSSRYPSLKETYENTLHEIESVPIIHQYLTLQAELNSKIQMITELIESALNKPFTDE